MNKAFLIGRLTADPEIRSTQSGKQVARYTLAVDRMKKDAGADFISCTAWESNAVFAEKYLKKGTKILVEGHIQTGSYDAKDGRKVYTTDIIVERQEFVESKKAAEEKPAESDGVPSFMDIPENADEELPFH